LVNNGWLKEQIDSGIVFGVTSNPSIFKNAISGGREYSLDIQTLSWAGFTTSSIYERLAVEDIRNVADMLSPVYESTNRMDGYVSLEVDPSLANDQVHTITEAKRLWGLVDRKNLMIKIPATKAGIISIRELIAAGININVTLIFSVDRYLEIIEAYLTGLEDRIEKNLSINHIHSVASFFVSRLDVKIEEKVADLIPSGDLLEKEAGSYLGKAGILNAIYAYTEFERFIHSPRFRNISKHGGNIQRPLWASTGTKNPDYSDVLYLDGLILSHTVNTVPPKTLSAFLDHGKCEIVNYSNAKADFNSLCERLVKIGLDFKKIWLELEEEGVLKFISAQNELTTAIEDKRTRNQRQLGDLKEGVIQRIEKIQEEGFLSRLFAPDPSIWTKESSEVEEILHRLGWIDAPLNSWKIVNTAEKLLKEIKTDGITHAVVLGMGGSSLAPEVFSKVFVENLESRKNGVYLSILDSTDAVQIKAKMDEVPIKKTLFIVSSKSGTTAEVRSLLAFFWNMLEESGEKTPGKHFILITDPKTPLEIYGKENEFRKVFNADPDVGGRYSALIAFGLIPAVLAGIDGRQILESANTMRGKCSEENSVEKNPGIVLAAIIAEAYFSGRDKITILADEPYQALGSWMEQLIAESSGKTGKGFLPIDREPIVLTENYSNDRIFYYLRSVGKHEQLVENLLDRGFPVIVTDLDNNYQLFAEMYKWEFAIAAACSFMGVNPFNQPDVQESKSITRKMIDAYKDNPVLEETNVLYEDDEIILSGKLDINGRKDRLDNLIIRFLTPNKGDYISINAFQERQTIY